MVGICLCLLVRAAVAFAVVMFLYGAAMKRGLSTTSRPGWRFNRAYYYGCTELKSGIFFTASSAALPAAYG